jgi:hypothetical protein
MTIPPKAADTNTWFPSSCQVTHRINRKTERMQC